MLSSQQPRDLVPRLVELAEVQLRRAVSVDGILYPAGSRGVIVWCYPDGEAFEVELFSPQPAVVIVLGQDLV